MSKRTRRLEQLAREQRRQGMVLSRESFMCAIVSRTAVDCLDAGIDFEGYQAKWLTWMTVKELEGKFHIPAYAIRREIKKGTFERYVAHDDRLLRIRLGDFVEWLKNSKKVQPSEESSV